MSIVMKKKAISRMTLLVLLATRRTISNTAIARTNNHSFIEAI
jgi:hypothetical protein